jgi:hypothetical protein
VYLLILMLIVVGVIVPLVGYGFGSLGRVGLRRADRRTWLRSIAAILGAVAAILYLGGLLIVLGAVLEAEDGGTDSAPLRPCRTPGQWERALGVVDYTVDFVPLRFVCETQDGGSYDAEAVPGYVNPAVLGFALGSAACAGASALPSNDGARPSGAGRAGRRPAP